ncbi:uncharacterized protein LOC116937557 isoform X1 [Petromyzon marinus]|uniref:Uncharacterized protein LOC116937557 isoform X1 n=1 Tax=Petromyzon marinus TaxID=7757 RepID=A0AAJ7SLH5_PETMA|nr:uncharacterized protein LOC116937557 isoform X1 [Petromyzon marinus]
MLTCTLTCTLTCSPAHELTCTLACTLTPPLTAFRSESTEFVPGRAAVLPASREEAVVGGGGEVRPRARRLPFLRRTARAAAVTGAARRFRAASGRRRVGRRVNVRVQTARCLTRHLSFVFVGFCSPPDVEKHVEATKISTVRVLGRDINNTLQLAHVTPRDAGLYECRVSDRSGVRAQEHKARATLHVGSRSQPRRDSQVPEARPLTKGAPPRAAAAPPTWNATTTAAATAAAATTRPSSVPRNDGDRRGRSQPAPTAAHGQQRRRQSGSGCPDPPLPWGILGLLLPLVW